MSLSLSVPVFVSGHGHGKGKEMDMDTHISINTNMDIGRDTDNAKDMHIFEIKLLLKYTGTGLLRYLVSPLS